MALRPELSQGFNFGISAQIWRVIDNRIGKIDKSILGSGQALNFGLSLRISSGLALKLVGKFRIFTQSPLPLNLKLAILIIRPAHLIFISALHFTVSFLIAQPLILVKGAIRTEILIFVKTSLAQRTAHLVAFGQSGQRIIVDVGIIANLKSTI